MTVAAWNIPLPLDASGRPTPALHASSAAIVDRLNSWSQALSAYPLRTDWADTTGDYNHPVFFAKDTDPQFTLQRCTVGNNYGSDFYGTTIHIPQVARPARGGDGHMCVVEENGDEWDMWKVSDVAGVRLTAIPNGGGTIYMAGLGKSNINGDGRNIGTNTGDATAARYGLLAGPMRGEELANNHIGHALWWSVKGDSGTAIFPATGLGSADGSGQGQAPPEGARFFIDYSYQQVEALSIPRWRKTIVHALREYGAIVGDTTGNTSIDLQPLSGTTYTALGLPDRFATYMASQGVIGDVDWRSGVDWSKLKVCAESVSSGVTPAPPTPTISAPTAGQVVTTATPAHAGTARNNAGDAVAVGVAIYAGTLTAPAGQKVSGTGVALATANRSGTSWSGAVSGTPLPNGTYTSQASQADTNGVLGYSTPPRTFSVAVTAPTNWPTGWPAQPVLPTTTPGGATFQKGVSNKEYVGLTNLDVSTSDYDNHNLIANNLVFRNCTFGYLGITDPSTNIWLIGCTIGLGGISTAFNIHNKTGLGLTAKPSNIVLDGCTIKDSVRPPGRDDIHIEGCHATNFSVLWFKNCHFTNNSLYNLSIQNWEATSTRYCLLEDSVLDACHQGYDVDHDQHSVVCWDNPQLGSPRDVIVRNNTIKVHDIYFDPIARNQGCVAYDNVNENGNPIPDQL